MKLTRAVRDRRIAIANDVIARLKSRKKSRMRVRDGGEGYFTARSPTPVEAGTQLHTVLDQLVWNQDCSVCALGALLIAKAALYDEVVVPYHAGWSRDTVNFYGWEIRDALDKDFDVATLDAIEKAFELRGDDALAEFGERYQSATARLRAIMQNVVDNNGEFKPEVALDQRSHARS